MGLGEADTRAKLIDPAIHKRGWTEDLIRREETAGAIEIIDGKPRKQTRGRFDYVLRIKVNAETQPVAVALAAKPCRLRTCAEHSTAPKPKRGRKSGYESSLSTDSLPRAMTRHF